MNVSIFSKMDYENKSDWTLGENKPNSNPNKPNFRKARMNVNLTFTKGYRKNDDFAVRINKPNSNPISEKAKMNANVFLTKDYENEPPRRTRKNKPNQSQFPCPQTSALAHYPLWFRLRRVRTQWFNLIPMRIFL
jgi:hypothetical protein